MVKDLLLSMSKDDREKIMREELGEEKCKILDKYNLYSNDRLYWERIQEKYPTQEYFSHKFALKSSPLGMIFHIYRLCFAKTKYFENHWDKFIPCYYDFKRGFVETDISNMEYIKQKSTGIVIDLRELAKIHWVKDFHDLCDYLEREEEKVMREDKIVNI
ncbi:hypothetical protein [Clostridium fallax]|uniref:Uncharacterized protein n=1 Tax=Clostridium fallax TaxID=1533 RepID=A0A1M4VYM0_9CLOT|nr:hypothetical protein [Clostridium fallax]SHE74000.1 hypothetical protein SAMN05443638_10984 [Clostridium fallax]SQB07756.1 Uncharacterised protein [Clostridium fallax]